MSSHFDLWAHFRLVGMSASGKTHQYTCVYCGRKYSRNTTRMADHLKDCSLTPEDVKTTLLNSVSEENGDSPDNSTPNSANKRKRPSGSRYRLVRHTSKREFKETERIIARAFYATATPFHSIENKHWQVMLSRFCQGYETLTKNHLSGALLDTEYTQVKSKINEILEEASRITLLTDIVIGDHSEVFINFIASTPKPIFLKSVSIHAGTEAQMADGIAFQIREIFKEIDYQKVVSIVTNDSKTARSVQNLLTGEYPHLNFYCCCSHIINLLLSDTLEVDWSKDLLCKCIDIVNYFNRNALALATLQNCQQEKYQRIIPLVMPVLDDYETIKNCYGCLLSSKSALHSAVTEAGFIDTHICNLVMSEDFWMNLKVYSDFMDPMIETALSFETSQPALSAVFDKFHSISQHINNCNLPIKTAIATFFNQKWQLIINPMMLLAYQLDPKFRGEHLLCEHNAKVIFMVSTMAGQNSSAALSELACFRSQQDKSVFSQSSVWDCASGVDAASWWELIKPSCPNLATIANIALSQPASVNACKPKWLSPLLVQEQRAKYDIETVDKIIFLHWNLNMLEEKDLNDITAEVKSIDESRGAEDDEEN